MYAPLENLDPNQTWTIEDLNRLKAIQLLPSIIYFSLISIVGVIGNICVIIIFFYRFSPTIHRYFILVLASYDLVASAIGGPFMVTESVFAFEYHDEVSCKIARLMFYFTCIASCLTLVLISIERHRKICLPLKKQFTLTHAKWAVFILSGVFSIISAIPAGILFGNSSVDTGIPSVIGTKCFIKDIYTGENLIFPVLHTMYLVVLAIIATFIMCFCYTQVARQVAKTGKANIEDRNKCNDNEVATEAEGTVDLDMSNDSMGLENGKDKELASKSSAISLSGVTGNQDGKEPKIKTQQKKPKLLHVAKPFVTSSYDRKTLRITKILTTVTIAFCVSYIPHQSLMLLQLFIAHDDNGLLPTDNLYRIMFYGCSFNNMLNPFIYAAMDLKFRAELKDLLTCQFKFVKQI
ncbi:hypothetical protein ACF0H5_006356 [Mactra antiquata]